MKKLNIHICAIASAQSGQEAAVSLGGVFNVPDCQSDSYQLTLDGLSYDKRMFSPSELVMHFSVLGQGGSSSLQKVLKTEFVDTECGVDVIKSIDKDGHNEYLLQNCYVYSAECGAPEKGKWTCSLKCYSIDHKLTLGRGCEVFAGVKFGESVFKEKAGKKTKCEFDLKRLLLMGYDESSKTRKLTFDVTTGVLNTRNVELIHPYLVRYNESEYAFLARVAHRCGEFMYFEDGELRLGLPAETMSHIADAEQENYTPVPGEYLCSYDDITGDIPSDHSEFCRNYVDGTVSPEPGGCVYDAQQASDEFLHLVSADDDMKDYAGWWIGVKALSILFTSRDLVSGLSSAIYSAVEDVTNTRGVLPAWHNSIFKSEYVNPAGKGEATCLNEEDVKDNLYNNLSSHFYHVIEKLEEKSACGKVNLNFSNAVPPLKLGGYMALKDNVHNNYIVTRIYGTLSYSGTSVTGQHNVEGVPVLAAGDDISGLEYVAVPPAGEISHFLKSEPMEAIVIRNDDPLRLNRVKVRYPWQKETDSFKKLSPWLRVAVPFAGSGESSGGFAMTPDVGEHVMLKYMDGNMERPYVKGSLYYRYKTDDDKLVSRHPAMGRNTSMQHRFFIPTFNTRTIASSKGHSLMFRDLEDTSLMSDVFPFLGTIYNITKVGDYEKSMLRQPIPYGKIKGGGINISDGSGLCQIDLSPDTRTVTVSSPYGSVNISAFTGMTVNAPNGDIRIKGKNVHIEAGNNLSIRAGANITGKGVRASDIAGFLTGSVLSKIGADISRRLTGIDLKGSLDLSFLRCVTELVLRPVEGTLSLHSNRNTVITAGKGDVNIPRSLFSNTSKSTLFHNTPYSVYGPAKTPRDITYLIRVYTQAVDGLYMAAEKAYKRIHDLAGHIVELENQAQNLFGGTYQNDYDFTINEGAFNVCYMAWNETKCGKMDDVIENYDDCRYAASFYDKFKSAYGKLVDEIKSYKKDISGLGALESHFKRLNNSGMKVTTKNFPDNYKTAFQSNTWWLMRDSYDPSCEDMKDEIKKFKGVMKRSVVCQILICCDTLKISVAKLQEHNPDIQSVTLESIQEYIVNPAGRDLAPFPAMNREQYNPQVPDWSDLETAIVPNQRSGKKSVSEAGHFASAMLGGVAGQLGGGLLSYDTADRKLSLLPQSRKLVNWDGESGPRAIYEVANRGNIMISDGEQSMIHLAPGSAEWKNMENHAPSVEADDNGNVKVSYPSIWNAIKDLRDE